MLRYVCAMLCRTVNIEVYFVHRGICVFQEAGLREGDYITAVNGVDCRWAKHAEVVRALKSCTERGLELDVITLQTHEVSGTRCGLLSGFICGSKNVALTNDIVIAFTQTERRTILSPTSEAQSCGSRKQGRDYERSLWTWSWRSGGVTKRLGSNFNLSFGNFRESESMY